MHTCESERASESERESPKHEAQAIDCLCSRTRPNTHTHTHTQNSCPKHGTEAIEWKCKFCCSVASWFCWGTTHFCDDCHRKQV